MSNLKILIVEGNLEEENQSFLKVGIETHTESLIYSLNHYSNKLDFDVINPSSDNNIQEVNKKLSSYDGLIWGGSSLNIYDNTPEIKRQIEFMKECQKKVKNILAICWGMQVAVTAAGGEVKKASNSQIGIANEIILNDKGFDKKYGARPLNRAIQKYIDDLLAENVVNNNIEEGIHITLDYKKGDEGLHIKSGKEIKEN